MPLKNDLAQAPQSVPANDETRSIDRNIRIHDQIARRYERTHGEIFNDIEQPRLRAALVRALGEVRSGRTPPHVLDFGCGSGNLTAHLLACGALVTAADVTPAFLDLVRARHHSPSLSFLRLNGKDLSEVADDTFEMIATYSVMHHVPDYLAACVEFARVCRPGGVIMIDHESSEHFWDEQPQHRQFQATASRFDWRKYLTPMSYVHRLRRIIDPRYSNEGDIHVWADDHIEWDKLRSVMADSGCEVVIDEDYLLFYELYRREVYEEYRDRYADTKLIVFRKALAWPTGSGTGEVCSAGWSTIA